MDFVQLIETVGTPLVILLMVMKQQEKKDAYVMQQQEKKDALILEANRELLQTNRELQETNSKLGDVVLEATVKNQVDIQFIKEGVLNIQEAIGISKGE